MPLVLLTLLLTGCWKGPAEVADPTSSTAPLESALAEVLDARARAVLMRDEPAFLDSVVPDKPGFRKLQGRLFDNLQELPLAAYDLELRGVTPSADGRVQAEVTVITQLASYDVVPVRTPARFTFVEGADDRWRVAADHDAAYDEEHGVDLQPWERTRIEAENDAGVLGIFDARSIDDAYQVMAAVHRGIDDIAPRIPIPWTRRVVVYALSDVAQMASLDELPGGDPERLEGVAFGVQAGGTSSAVASVRFMLHPRMLGRDTPRRDRLIRHELTHVAIGDRDDRVPTWLAEGIAEWVSVRAVPRDQRVISRAAVEEAQAGLTALPADAAFNGEHASANYGISWWACEVIVTRFGREALWSLLNQMAAGEGTTDADQDAVLRQVLGLTGADLAQAAGRRIVNAFA